MSTVTLRDFRVTDTDDLYDVCLKTGDSGRDATQLVSRPRLLGDLFVGPYLHICPELALVADDDERAAGYALAAVDTARFERELDERWWTNVCAEYPERDPRVTDLEAEMLELAHHPELMRHPELPGYPSHLHIDLLEHIRGSGVGGRMLDALFVRLRAAGSPGVHLGVAAENLGAQRFYGRLGFEELLRRGDEVFLGLRWQ